MLDTWQELNLTQLDATMGQKWMQKELLKTFGVNGGYTNLDLRRVTSYGKRPHILGDFTRTPFKNDAFDLILFDPPFLTDRPSVSGADYRKRTFSHYRNTRELGRDYGDTEQMWMTRNQLRKYLFKAFTELRRILSPKGRIIFKWTNSDASLKYALSVKNGLATERIWKRKSRGGKLSTTYYVWLFKP